MNAALEAAAAAAAAPAAAPASPVPTNSNGANGNNGGSASTTTTTSGPVPSCNVENDVMSVDNLRTTFVESLLKASRLVIGSENQDSVKVFAEAYKR
jgi:hypothetical protein